MPFCPGRLGGLRPCTQKPHASGAAFAVALDNAAALIPPLAWSLAMRTSQLRLKLPLAASALEGSDLPSTLTRAASDTGGPVLPVVPGVRGMPIQETVAQSHLLALEASDGTTVFIRADKLAEDLARVRPELVEADGSIDLGGFRGQETAFRGLGVWVWRQVHTLAVEDNVENLAKGKHAFGEGGLKALRGSVRVIEPRNLLARQACADGALD